MLPFLVMDPLVMDLILRENMAIHIDKIIDTFTYWTDILMHNSCQSWVLIEAMNEMKTERERVLVMILIENY